MRAWSVRRAACERRHHPRFRLRRILHELRTWADQKVLRWGVRRGGVLWSGPSLSPVAQAYVPSHGSALVFRRVGCQQQYSN